MFTFIRRIIHGKEYVLCAILFLGFTTCIYAPFEMYSLNSEDLWFSLSDIWYIPIACGSFAMIVAILIALLLKETLLKVYAGLLFGIGISSYIQGNFLNLNLGELTGAAITWQNYIPRMVVDLVIWGGIIIAFIIWNVRSSKYCRKVIGIVSLFLTVVQLVTLIVLTVPLMGESKVSPNGYPTEKDALSVSSNANVMVFVLDKYDENFFKDVLEREPEFRDKLDGFTYYTNMVGCYSGTKWAIPFMLSGEFCYQGDASAYTKNACEDEDVYWDELLKNGFEMSIYTRGSDVPPRAAANAYNFEKTSYRIANHKLFTVVLYRFVMCKYFPDAVKPFVWIYGYEFDDRKMLDSEYREWQARNLTLSDLLARGEVKADRSLPQYKFIHISGTHESFDIDEEGNRIEGQSDEATCAKGSLNLVLRYLRQMEELGVYDNSAVIITADHGNWSETPTNPVFLVKPMGVRGKLKENAAPVSQEDLGATILDLVGLPYEKYGISALQVEEGEQRVRLCYRYADDGTDLRGKPQDKLVEFVADSEDNEPDNFSRTGVEYNMQGEKIVIGSGNN